MSTVRPEGAKPPVEGPERRAAEPLAPAPARRFETVHVLGSRELGGADRFFIRLVEALTRAGHPTLAVTRRDGPVAAQLSPAVEQLHLPLASKWDLPSRWRLTRANVAGGCA